jgi:16S rRNA (uracil1498-N3)-methyltransferase
MRIPRIFVDNVLEENTEVSLDITQTHYLRNVLKLNCSDSVVLFNGKGGEYSGILVASKKSSLIVRLGKLDPKDRESPLRTHLGIGVSRGERMNYAIQKATELGVSRITPLMTARCEVKLSQTRRIAKVDQWQRVVVNACQQSRRTRVPVVGSIIDLDKWCKETCSPAKFILDIEGKELADSIPAKLEDVAILAGPEGGFEQREISTAVHSGFQRWRLGPRVLRAETAPLVALSILQSAHGDIP